MAFPNEELNEFKIEATEILDAAEKSLFEIERGLDFRIAFDSAFRAFHNLKGASGMMELHVLQAHVHELETILMTFKEKDGIPKDYLDFFFRGIDGARKILEGQEIHFDYHIGDTAEAPIATVTPIVASIANLEFIAEGEEILERVSTLLRLVESGKHSRETLNDLYRDLHSLKGASFLYGYGELGAVAHAMESSMEEVREGVKVASKDLLELFYKAIGVLEIELEGIKLNTVNLDNRANAEILKKALEAANKPEKEEEKMSIEVVPVAVSAEAPEKEGEGGGSIRVPISLLDNLMTLVGEMVLVRNQVLQFSNQSEDLNFLNLSKRLNVVTSEIQGEMMKTRMQPIGNILSKYHRVVRDLSQELGKGILLTLTGAETELDKSLLESIKDPLTHIVRNSCDHGIETPELRRKAGKPENGTIHIRSFHEGGQVVVEVSDDGKGLQKEALVKKALEKNLISQGQVASMSEKEIFDLIFAPGFSTAAVVTNVSGRGVGMDVVRTNIEKIGGTVELSSVLGKGTTIKIRIPLTLAIIPALIVKNGEKTFAIPQVKLEELLRVDSSAENKIEYLHGAPVYRLRGNLLPLVDLGQILGSKKEISQDALYNIAVLSSDQCDFGLIVDEIQDTADIVVKPLNRLLKSLQVYSGATILGDGAIALILDVQGISKVARVGSGKEARKSERVEQKRTSDFQEYLLIGLNTPTKHALVLGYVNRLEEFDRAMIETSGDSQVVRYGKSILPLLSVSELLGYGTKTPNAEREKISVVVIQKAGVFYGLQVDEIIDTLSSDADVDTSLVRQRGFFGNLNTDDGLIVAIDPFELINLAYPEKEVTAAHAGAIPVRVKRQLKILFVEDTAFFRKAVSIILQKEGHMVTFANDGQEAMEILNQNLNQFDLVISDIEMPRMNGFEFAKAVRANGKYADLPMLALSSRADKKYADLGIQAGFNQYLEKLKPAILLNAISQLSATERRAA